MADYGLTKRYIRAKVPLQVLRGFNPTEPGKLSSLAAPLDIVDQAGDAIAGRVVIKSGMGIVKTTGYVDGIVAAEGFANAVAADATSGARVFIALHDYDAHDVQAAGSLVGLDCSDRFEVQTGYYDPDIVWAVGDAVQVTAGGIFTRALATKYIVGYITAIGDGTNNVIVTGGKTPSASNMNVIQFSTSQNGQQEQA